MEVIRAIVDSSFPDHEIKFRERNAWDQFVLVFGRAPEDAGHSQLIYTYSIAQLMSKANAASVLTAGIQQFITEPVVPPFQKPLGTVDGWWIFNRMDFTKPVVIDIETDGVLGKEQTPEEVNVISIGFYQPGGPPIVLHSGVRWIDEKNRTGQEPLTAEQIMWLATVVPKFEKAIYHNGKFDTRVLNRVLSVKLCVWFDTMLAHHVLNHAAGDHKLKTLARRYLAAPEWEADLKKYTVNGGHYEYIPTDKLIEYNGWDVYWTYKLFEFLAPLIEADENNVKAFQLETAAAEFLLDVETYGIPFDAEYAASYADELGQEQAAILYDIKQLVGTVLNPNSPKQVKEYLAEIGLVVGSTDEATLTDLLPKLVNSKDFVVVKLILEYRKAGKIRGTYAEGWLNKERNGRVHPTYLVHGTSTGRLSSTGPNAQNVPRDKKIRKLVRTLAD
jgi:DNA polymerase I-like protein with 3'-5' exonuclease and polymerase domains